MVEKKKNDKAQKCRDFRTHLFSEYRGVSRVVHTEQALNM